MKRGMILLKEAGYLLLALVVIAAVVLAFSRGCSIMQSSKEKAQAEGTLEQLSNFLDSMKDNEQNNFLIYSPKGYYLTSFEEGKSIQCTTNCVCICKDSGCLTDASYCRDIKKSISGIGTVVIGLESLIIINHPGNYEAIVVQFDDANEEVFNVTAKCSGPLVALTGRFQIRESVKPAFEEAQRYAQSLGQELIVTSAYRTAEYQKELLSSLGPDTACTPRDTPNGFGMNCPHVIGCAIDVHLNSTLGLSKSTKNDDTMLLRKIMEHAGFVGYSLDSKNFEFWHFNYGISTKSPVPTQTVMGQKYQYSK